MKTIPWITVLILVLMLYMVSGTLTRSEGMLFDLPATGLADGVATELVCVVQPMARGVLIFFDDERYDIDDSEQLQRFGQQIERRASHTEHHTLLALIDSRVPLEDIARIMSVAKAHGVKRVLVANRRQEAHE